MIVLGIDPGQHTGWVLVEAPSIRILASGTLNAASFSDPDDSDGATLLKMRSCFADLAAEYVIGLIASEQPIDAKPFWGAQKGVRKEGTGTSFRSGVYFGLMRAAVPGYVPFVSYPVHGFGKRSGWMPARAKRGELLGRLSLAARAAKGDLQTDHELMAFGVALHAIRMAKKL